MSASDGGSGWSPLFSPGAPGGAAARRDTRSHNRRRGRTSAPSNHQHRRGDGTAAALRRGESPSPDASAGPPAVYDYERSRSSEYEYDPYRRQSSGSSTAFGSSSHQRGAASRKHKKQQQQQQRPPPTLTVILTRLEACLASYCGALSTPTGPNARKAARILDDSLYPPAGGSHSSTDATTPSVVPSPPLPQQQQQQQQSSSPLSNIGTWARRKIPSHYLSNLSSSSSPYHFSSSNASAGAGAFVSGRGSDPALEAEWQRMVDPLTLLAGAESWYGGLEHLAVPIVSSSDGDKGKAAPASSDGKASVRRRSRIKRGTMTPETWETSGRQNTSGPLFSAATVPSPPSQPHENTPSLSPEAERMRSIYGKVMSDLIILKEILCDPMTMAAPSVASEIPEHGRSDPSSLIPPAQDFLKSQPKAGHATGDEAQAQTDKATPQRAAESLAEALTALAKLCHVRQNMIAMHSDMVALSSAPKEEGNASAAGVVASQICLLGLADRCEEVLTALPKDCASSATAPMVEATRHEIAATKAALRMMAHLETCSFFETVINIKRLETHLGPSSQFHSDPPCSLEMWLRQMLREGLSLMSVYYDRVDAYANSSFGYSFQRHIMIEDKGGQQDLSKVSSAVATAAGAPSSPLPQGSPTASSQGPAPYTSRKTAWHGHVQDLDSEVIDLLHIHEERNGPALAVALFVDAKDRSGTTERGFTTKSTSSDTTEIWPPVYLRTSTKSGNPDFESTLVGGNAATSRRSGPRRAGPKGMSMTSLSNLLSSGGEGQGLSIKRPSYGGNTSRGSLVSIVSDTSLGLDGSEVATNLGPSPVVKAAEYGFRANSGTEARAPPSSLSWPHSEISGIVSIMRDNNNPAKGTSPRSLDPQRTDSARSPNLVASFDTPRRRKPFDFSPLVEEAEEPSFDGSAAASPVRSITALATSPTSPSSPLLSSPSGDKYHLGSSYHFIQVQETMWLSVIVKGEDEGGRLRRRTGGRGGLTDEEVRMWLSQFAAKLRTSRLFGPKSVASARKASKGLSLPAQATAVSRAGLTSDGKEIRWKDSEAADVLVSLKESFGLQSSCSPLATRPLKSPYISRGGSKKFGGAASRSASLSDEAIVQDEAVSAAAFFLGADLGRVLNPFGM